MDARTPQDVVQFGRFRLDRRLGRLLRSTDDGRVEQVGLGSRAIGVLCALIDHDGDLVSKDEIMAAVWPSLVVEDSNLTVQISALRRVLDEDRGEGSCIQTVAGRGYRFGLPVRHVDEAPPAAGARVPNGWPLLPAASGLRAGIACGFQPAALLVTGGGAPSPASIATQPAIAADRRQSMIILPFENSSADAAQDGLAARVTREVMNRVLSGPDGAIIAGTTAWRYQGVPVDPRVIGREHDVHFVLTGDAQRHDGHLIVAAALYETAGGGPVWARQLEVPDGPDALPTIAQVIYENSWQRRVDFEAWHALHDHPDSLDKRDLILIALSTPLWSPTKANYLQKLSLVDHALALDPNYLRGWERRARLLVELLQLGYSADPAADLARATEAADRALALDAHAQLSLRVKAAVLRARGEWTEAEAVQRRVISLVPTESFRHYELGLILLAQGRHREALASLQTARQSAGGNNPVYWYDGEIAMAHLALGRFAEAIAAARLAIGEMPPDVGRSEELPWLALIAATGCSKNDEAADAALRKFLAVPRDWRSMAEVRKWPAFGANPNLLEGLRRAGLPAN